METIVALLLALTGAFLAYCQAQRAAGAPPAAASPTNSMRTSSSPSDYSTPHPTEPTSTPIHERTSARSPDSPPPPADKVAEKPLATEPEPAIPQTTDTPAALRALRLAQSYLEETDGGNFSDPDSARTLRTTLALASRQLDIAFCADPNAKIETGDGEIVSQAHLRARVLCQEALTWEMENLSKATAIAERATIADPDFPGAFHVLGILHYENRNKDAAVAALTKASELDPDNIEIFKILDRAQSMGAAEIATFKATRAGIRAANAGIGVYNAGVRVRNFFVIIWNVFATAYNVVTWPLRIVSKILRFF